MDGARQIDYIGGVEDVIAVESQGAVVVPQVEGIECGTRALSVVIVTIANSENVAPSVIQGEYSSMTMPL